MRNRLIYTILIVCSLLFSEMAAAEVVYLKSGSKISGTIVFQNEEVVVIKDATGARYQYMMSDVEKIAAEEEEVKEEEVKAVAYKTHKVAVGIQLAGGGSVIPREQQGGNFQGDLVIGTANLFDRHILLGGGVGYHVNFVGGQNYSFIPLQLRAEVPLMTSKHAPMLAAGVGYGFAITKGVSGGLFADIDFGWRYQINNNRALFLGLYTNFQDAQLTITETYNNNEYTGKANRNFCDFGVKFGLYL